MCFLDCYLNPLYIHNIYTSSMDSILCFLEFYLEFYLQPQTYVFFLKVNDTGNKTTRKGDWIKGKNRTLNGIIDNQSKWASDTDSRKEDLKYFLIANLNQFFLRLRLGAVHFGHPDALPLRLRLGAVHVGHPDALPLRLLLRAGGGDGEVVGSPQDAVCARQHRPMWVVVGELLRECRHIHPF